MSRQISLKTTLLYGIAILLGMVLGPFVSNLASGFHISTGQSNQAKAADPIMPVELSPDSPDAIFTCSPSYVGEFDNRVHVRCSTAAPGAIYYFATPTSDSKRAARVLSVFLTAKALGKNLRMYYNPNSSGSSFGCGYSDCRPIDYVEIMP